MESNSVTNTDSEPMEYDQFLSAIKEADFLDRRRLREQFSQNFPPSNELWLEWIDDELSRESPEFEYLLPLLDRAARSLNSFNIWNIYVDLVMATSNHVDEVIQVIDEALKCCGNHVGLSHCLWEKARQFERSQEVPDEERLSELYVKEIGVPTMELETVWEEFSEWSGKSSIPKLAESRRLIRLFQPFEDNLNKEPTLSLFDEYLSANTHVSATKRRQNILERILDLFPDSEPHWSLYIQLLLSRYDSTETYLKSVNSVVERANFLFPDNSSFWVYRIQLIRYSPRNTCDEKLLAIFAEVFHAAFSVKFPSSKDYKGLYLAAIMFYKMRHVENGFSTEHYDSVCEMCDYALHFFQTNFPDDLVSLSEILLFYGKFVAKTDFEKSRNVFEWIVTTELREKFRYWNDYYTLESCYGDTTSQRRVLKRAVACVRDHTQMIADLYIGFERIHGDHNSYWMAVRIITEKKRNYVQNFAGKAQSYKKSAKNDKNFNKTRNLEERVDIRENVTSSSKTDDTEVTDDPNKPNSSEKFSKNTKSNKKRLRIESGIESPAKRIRSEKERNLCTVFVSNLSYSVKSEDIRHRFDQVGSVRDVRIVGDDSRGKHRGFAYVEFETEDDATQALKLDRSLVETRPMFVSSYGSQGFQYNTDLEKTKLFVRNLPQEMDSVGLGEFLKRNGITGVKDVRLVTRKSGKSKRVAYVDFVDESASQVALTVLDGFDAGGCVLIAAFSNPPAKTLKEDFPVVNRKKSSMRQKTMIDFVPRAVRRET